MSIIWKMLVAFMLMGANSAFAGQTIKTGAKAPQPPGQAEFCKTWAQECAYVGTPKQKIVWDTRTRSSAERINKRYNHSITPTSDFESCGKEECWTRDTGRGDCEEYARAKRQALINQGFSPGNVRMAFVRARVKEPGKPAEWVGHWVVVLNTNKGDYVMDNLRPAILPWNKTGHKFVQIVSVQNTGSWVLIK